METGRTAPEARTRTLLWIVFLSTVAIYGVIGTVLPVTRTAPPPAWMAAVAALFLAMNAVFLPRVFEASEAAPLTRDMLQWACDESVAVMGLVFRFLGRPAGEMWIYLAASALLLWLHRPRR